MEIVEAKNTPTYIYGQAHTWKTGMAIRTMLQAYAKLPVVGSASSLNQITLMGFEESVENTLEKMIMIGGFKDKADMADFFKKRGGVNFASVFNHSEGTDDGSPLKTAISRYKEEGHHILVIDNISCLSDSSQAMREAFEYASKPNTTVIVTDRFSAGNMFQARPERFNVAIQMLGWKADSAMSYDVKVKPGQWDDVHLNLSSQ